MTATAEYIEIKRTLFIISVSDSPVGGKNPRIKRGKAIRY